MVLPSTNIDIMIYNPFSYKVSLRNFLQKVYPISIYVSICGRITSTYHGYTAIRNYHVFAPVEIIRAYSHDNS